MSRLFFLAFLLSCQIAPAWANDCPLKRLASMPMVLNRAREVVIPVTLQGKMPGKLMIDTGAPVSAISQSVAAALDLEGRPLQGGIYGFGGRKVETGVTLDLKLDQMVARGAVLPVAPEAVFGGRSDISGIFGADFLSNYDLELDFGGGKVNLFSSDHCAGQVVYWAKDFIAIPFTMDAGHHIELPVELDGKRMRAMLDTGASLTLIGWRDAGLIFGIDRELPGVQAGGMVMTFDGAKMPASTYRFHTLDIGGIAFHDPELLLTEQHQMGTETRGSAMNQAELDRPTLVLGMSELTKLHLYIAYGERVLYVTPAKAGS